MKLGISSSERFRDPGIPGGAAVQVATMSVLAAFFACCLDSGGMLIGGVGRYGVALTGFAMLVLLLLRGRLGRRWSRRWVSPLSLTLGVAVWAWLLTAPSLETLRKQGQGLVDAIEKASAEEGAYPKALEEVGLGLPASRYGWTYDVPAASTRFVLRVGDYARDGFVLSYRSDRGRWSEDT
jgi:hypothetical protein